MPLNLDFWIMQTLAMMLTAMLLPGVRVTGPLGAFVAVAGLAFFNAHLWNAALFFQVPDSLSIQAAALLVTNGALFWIIAKILPGIEVTGALSAFAAPVVFTLCSIFISRYTTTIDWRQVWDVLRSFFQQLQGQF
jgi:putative membrane protein